MTVVDRSSIQQLCTSKTTRMSAIVIYVPHKHWSCTHSHLHSLTLALTHTHTWSVMGGSDNCKLIGIGSQLTFTCSHLHSLTPALTHTPPIWTVHLSSCLDHPQLWTPLPFPFAPPPDTVEPGTETDQPPAHRLTITHTDVSSVYIVYTYIHIVSF